MKKKYNSKLSRRQFLGGAGSAALATLVASRANAMSSYSSDLTTIAEVRIYPAIGIARIGNSIDAKDDFFYGPEVAEPQNIIGNQSPRDSDGNLKRQAARFRVYAFNRNGDVIGELTAHNAKINWRAHLANKKSQWYRFIAALDLPEATSLSAPRRNPEVTGTARNDLIIDAGTATISGPNLRGVNLDAGKFQGKKVSLGELRTDEDGRLVVLGGMGVSESPTSQPIYDLSDEDSFNNADGWYDDISDGPIRATVQVNGRNFEAKPAWVVVAPPNYAPQVIGWRTLYDLIYDAHVEANYLQHPTVTSFTEDILPILHRLTNLQWVNNGFAESFGASGKEFNFADPDLIQTLSEPTVQQKQLAQKIFKNFRVARDPLTISNLNPDSNAYRRLWPMLYGDSYGAFKNSVNNSVALSGVRLFHMNNWVNGTFVADWNPNHAPFREIHSVPLSQQPEMLNRAALHFCIADAFHPGCEVTWPIRNASIFEKPANADPRLAFRIKTRAETDSLLLDYGDQLTQSICFQDIGPIQAQGPGDLTKWMALPWQGDTAFCRSGYEPEFDPYLPSFWPARVPNHVLSYDDYLTVVNPSVDNDTRIAAFKNRLPWHRQLTGHVQDQMIQMTQMFSQMGVVEVMRGPSDLTGIPQTIMVENVARRMVVPAPAPGGGTVAHAGPSDDWMTSDGHINWSKVAKIMNAQFPHRMADIAKLISAVRPIWNSQKMLAAGWENPLQFLEFRLLKHRKAK